MVALEQRPKFARLLLEALGFDDTEWRVNFFLEWMRWENTVAENNALATTMPMGHSHPSKTYPMNSDNPYFNDNGGNPVKNYRDEASGIKANVATLKLSYYDTIRACLANQKIPKDLRGVVADEVRTWGTMGFAREIENGFRPGGSTVNDAHRTNSKKSNTKSLLQKSTRDATVIGGSGAALMTMVETGTVSGESQSAIEHFASGFVSGDAAVVIAVVAAIAFPYVYRWVRDKWQDE